MPKPLYMICAQGAVEDKRTNLVSFYNVLEKLIVQVKEEGDKEKRSLPPRWRFRAIAVWMREESDPFDQEFESQMQMILPPDNRVLDIPGIAKFKFQEGKHLKRVSLEFDGAPPRGPGILRLVSLVRAVGSDEWLRQEYPIIVEFQKAAPGGAEAEPTADGGEKARGPDGALGG